MHLSLNFLLLASGFLGSVVSAANSINVCSSCTYKTVSAALASLPNNSATWTIYVAPGTYNEQIKIRRSNVILKPSTSGTVQIQHNGMRDTQSSSGTNEQSATLSVYGSNVKVYNMIIANIYPQTRNIANLALNLQATQASFYNVKFYGFQDTVLIALGTTSYFKNCYIEGSVDYIWGYGTAYFDHTTVATNQRGGFITAHNRQTANAVGGFYFNSCTAIATLPSGPLKATANSALSFTSTSQFPQSTYLGRPWSQYARVIFIYSELGAHINPVGWTQWSSSSPNTDGVLFGEYSNTGDGKWNDSSRASFATLLTASQAAYYSIGNVLGSTSWIDTSV
ncbi:carbohydrate esterase family 8 protein [Phycomyces blakesleeanus]|uniref:pectinesterase n=2 Tax=Phycomyces blakesleeanus TaxID=4837 RepID=A0A167QEF2_PHYB8|nr:carbohydrate esterase family 8 protein [Phycomyces blakesleeanus NRRL 1555(-)]OAD79580.1 carbohydrate esterase family 8 protein [Phycomyces blakesleeanus NRRL 1555(-)]|eukprot:XP_018297620.1 carbohydrate esterase family 8 protein [Phycomyces blakesleeanus NRRL 1555(-)]